MTTYFLPLENILQWQFDLHTASTSRDQILRCSISCS